MALTRKALKAMGLTDEQVESIVEMHTETVDALKEQRDQYKTELDEAKANSNSEYEEKYNAEHEAFEQYKFEIAAKETRAAKLNAGRAILKDAGVPENRIDTLMRAYDVDGIELDEHGAAKDRENRVNNAKTEFASFIPTTTETGVKTATPPATKQERAYTRDDIRKMTPEEINANFEQIKASLKGEN